ncbi:hypothetical protein [Sodalinema gerasimenkoae]|uniref:hypothetical protein n=1 Tax=Sodalinema gerasimenkoae TaxID=2862348 RepID=UPI00135B95AD|nr:hypothetical protein [Sodalinema gerasimenkoae]
MANPLHNGLAFKLAVIAACQVAGIVDLPPDVGAAVQKLGSVVVSVADDRTLRNWLDQLSNRKKDEEDEQDNEEDSSCSDGGDCQEDERAEEDENDNNCQEDSEDCADGKEDDPEIED